MSNELISLRLHDRATRGETLTADEQVALDQWYSKQDRLEAAALATPPATHDDQLQRQVQASLEQLTVVTARIQALALDNETVRRENADLRKRLAQRSASSAA